jgi:Activator of Hsp90 ATPase homolog 1-like protein
MSTSVGTESEAQTAGKPGGPLEVQVSLPVAAPLTHVWEVLVSPPGSQALLGEGAVLGGKGEPYHCTAGSGGVVRSYHPLEQLRVSWHETPDGPPTIVQVDLSADGDSTVMELTQTHLNEAHDVDALADRWKAALAELARVARSDA